MSEPLESPDPMETLTRMMIGLLLYRLGGEQSFSPEEIREIQDYVAGVQIFVSDDGNFVVRSKTPGQLSEALGDPEGPGVF
jgi:hypothetical protein